MKYLALIPLLLATPAWGQDPLIVPEEGKPDCESYIHGCSVQYKVEEFFVDGIYDGSKKTFDLPASIDVITDTKLDKISSIHPAEALNGVAGVNIHRGSGQEHLTAIRSPVLTGGAGAGSFLYLEDGVPGLPM